jgi:PAS domain S-box-containing protein
MQKSDKDQNGTNFGESFFEKEAMFVYDFHSLKILDVNNQAIQRYGYSRDEFIGKRISDLGQKVALSDLEIKDVAISRNYLKELQRHFNKSGESWYVQLTSQEFRFDSRPVRLAIAHDIDDIVSSKSLDHRKLPRIDLLRNEMPFAFIEWDKDLTVRDFSKKSQDG